MKYPLICLVAALSMSAGAEPANSPTVSENATVVAFEVPGTEHRGIENPLPNGPMEPIFEPEDTQPTDSTWDDTADTSDDLERAYDREDLESDVELDVDLRNDPDDGLFEDHRVEDREIIPLDDSTELPPVE